MLFRSALSETSDCMVQNKAIITKVYFPRILLPFSAIFTKFVDFCIASGILVVLMFHYHFLPHLGGLFILPLLLLVSFLAASGGGLILASINVKYRDVRYVLPFFIQMLLFVTPVIYPASIAGGYSWLLAFNPMTGVIKAAQAAILGTAPVNWLLLGISFGVSLVLFILGVLYFKKTERYFADIV